MTKRNPFILVLAGVGALLFGGLLFVANTVSSSGGEGVSAPPAEPITVGVDERQMSVMGTFSDTPADTLRTVGAAYESAIGKQQQLSEQLDATKSALDSTQSQLESTQSQLTTQQTEHSEQVSQLETQLSRLSARLESALGSIEDGTFSARQGLWEHQQPVRDANGNGDANSPYDALGIDSPKEGQEGWIVGKHTPDMSAQTLVWTDPLDAKRDDNGAWITPTLTAIKSSASKVGGSFEQSTGRFDADRNQGTPVYTLHRGSVLADSVSLTALMGRIPMNGQVTDPYPFSMIIGSKNLMASGFTLPDVQGAIVTGTVTGDWSLSCVRGVVESIDFIRRDGSILSFPQESEAIDSGFDGTNVKTSDLGFLADPNGNPCLSGIRISNAPEYLTTKGLLDAASAAASAAAIAQQTVSVEGSTTTSALTGNAMKNAAGQSAAAFTTTVSEFIQARMGSSFDIIYVEPGVKAAVHLRKPITLRTPSLPVKVKYTTETQGALYALP